MFLCEILEIILWLEVRRQLEALLPRQHIGDIGQQIPKQLLSTLVQLWLQRTLVLTK